MILETKNPFFESKALCHPLRPTPRDSPRRSALQAALCAWHSFTLVTIFLEDFYITSPFKMVFLASRCKQLRILWALHCSPLFFSSLSSCSVEKGINWGLVIPVLERLFSTSRRFHPNNICYFPSLSLHGDIGWIPSFWTTNLVFLLWQDKIIHEYYTCTAIMILFKRIKIMVHHVT